MRNPDQSDYTALSAEELSSLWRGHLTGRVPDHLPRSLLARVLSHRLQAEREGGISKKSAAYLKTIEADLRAGREPETPTVGQRQLKPGCQLVREHGGMMHHVVVMQDGYVWNGKTFASLSAVARAITGTNWSGHRFFGLKDRETVTEEAKP